MPRYQRTQFEEEEAANNVNDNSTVIFPPDITRGFSNPNSSFESTFKSTTITQDANSSNGETTADTSTLHPMVHLQRNTLGKQSTYQDTSVPGVQFFKGKILRPFGIKFNFSQSNSTGGSFLSNRSSLEKFLLIISILTFVTLIIFIIFFYQQQGKIIIVTI